MPRGLVQSVQRAAQEAPHEGGDRPSSVARRAFARSSCALAFGGSFWAIVLASTALGVVGCGRLRFDGVDALSAMDAPLSAMDAPVSPMDAPVSAMDALDTLRDARAIEDAVLDADLVDAGVPDAWSIDARLEACGAGADCDEVRGCPRGQFCAGIPARPLARGMCRPITTPGEGSPCTTDLRCEPGLECDRSSAPGTCRPCWMTQTYRGSSVDFVDSSRNDVEVRGVGSVVTELRVVGTISCEGCDFASVGMTTPSGTMRGLAVTGPGSFDEVVPVPRDEAASGTWTFQVNVGNFGVDPQIGTWTWSATLRTRQD